MLHNNKNKFKWNLIQIITIILIHFQAIISGLHDSDHLWFVRPNFEMSIKNTKGVDTLHSQYECIYPVC